MPTELFIIGTAGLAKEAAQLARQIDPQGLRWARIRYVTNDPRLLGTTLPYGSVDLLDAELASSQRTAEVVIGSGRPAVRHRLAREWAARPQISFPNLIHPSVEIDAGYVHIGLGNMITRGVVMTCDIQIGDFNLVNWNSTVGHDARIGSGCVLNPGSSVSGAVTLGNACLLGTGARIVEGLSIADTTTIGAGAVVTRSITEPGGTFVGIPARRIRP
jgi:sugar O-acyltransferase (sialic acid O-acetyltransferase NeuD family)